MQQVGSDAVPQILQSSPLACQSQDHRRLVTEDRNLDMHKKNVDWSGKLANHQ